MFKKLNFLCIFLGIIEFVCFQNWTVCHNVRSQFQFPQLELHLEYCYFIKHFIDKVICCLWGDVQFSLVLSDVSGRCKVTHLIVIPKLRKCLTSLHTCFSAFDHNPTSQLPGNREHLHTHITQPIFKLAMIHSSYEINKFIKSLVTTLVFVRYHTQFSGFIKQ